jgi:DNA-binding response OmpR family regulator
VLDWMMPGLDGVEVCRKVRALAHRSAVHYPLTARRNKDDIVEGLKAGANDYIIKPYYNEELQARLGVGQRVVDLQRALRDRVEQLEDALAHVRTLQGILPICSYCHKIRSDKESWERLENYIVQHSEAKFTHGICPECMKKQLAELEK